jgi:hypothetical protein
MLGKVCFISKGTYMFNSMSHSRHVILVTEAPDIDVHRSAGLVRLGVMDQKNLELVRETDDPVRPVIQRGSLQAICDEFDFGRERAASGNPGDGRAHRGLRIGLWRRHDGMPTST